MIWNIIYVLAFVVSMALTSYIIPKIIVISYKKKLFDVVDSRKVHVGCVPRLGGVAFTPTIIITSCLVAGVYVANGPVERVSLLSYAPLVVLYLCSLVILYLEGIADDLVGVGYKPKFAVMFFVSMLVVWSGTYVHDFQGLFFLHRIPALVGALLSMVLIVFVINAINLIDGVDGLASGLSMLAFFFFFVLFASRHDVFFASLALVSLGMLIPFWVFNVFGKVEKQRKIFMGDTGAQTVGLLLSLLAMRLAMARPDTEGWFSCPLMVAMTLLLVPCFDVVRVFCWRIRHRRNPFLPDKQHIHHKLMAIGMSGRTTMMIIIAVEAFYILLNLSMLTVADVNIVLLTDVVSYAVLHIVLSYIIRRKESMTPAKAPLAATMSERQQSCSGGRIPGGEAATGRAYALSAGWSKLSQ